MRREQGASISAAYPAVSAWLGRVGSDPGHVPIDWLP